MYTPSSRRNMLGFVAGCLAAALTVGHFTALAETITADDGSEMILIPAGPFIMGTELGKPDASPPHKVDLPAYYIDKYEVTIGQYAKFLEATGHTPPPGWDGPQAPEGQENIPITNITWFDAMRYADWAGKRLPTEAEWEKAARGTDGRPYVYGFNKNRDLANHTADKLAPGDQYPEDKSPYGVMSMSGNAREWVADWFDAYPGSMTRELHFGKHYKVIRGGSSEYLYGANNDGETTERIHLLPYGAHDYIGFRCVKDADPAQAPYKTQALLDEAESILNSFQREPVELSYEKEFKKIKQAGAFEVTVHGEPGQNGYVRTGLPFAKGMLKDTAPIAVRKATDSGSVLPSQVKTMCQWEDGSVRWALVDFPAEAGQQYQVNFTNESPGKNTPGLSLERDGKRIEINTGKVAFGISPEMLIEKIRYADEKVRYHHMRLDMKVVGEDGPHMLKALPADEIVVEEEGPLHAVIRLNGKMGDGDEPSGMEYQVRLHACADSPKLNILVTYTYMINRKDNEAKHHEPMMKVADARAYFVRSDNTQMGRLALPMDRGIESFPAYSPIIIRQQNDLHFSVDKVTGQDETESLADGQRFGGWAALSADDYYLAFGVRYFWQNQPNEIFVKPEAVGLDFWAGEEPFEWEATLAKTHELVLDKIESPDAGWVMDPLRASLPPAWACGTNALGGPLLPRSVEAITRFPYWEHMRETSMLKTVKSMPSGMRHFGDVYLGGPYKGKNAYLNLEYDFSFNFLMQFLRTGDVWYLESAEPMARHQADIDTNHVTGQPYKHSPMHTTTYSDIAHMFIRGMITHYWMTGEQRSLDVAREIGDHIAARTLKRDGYGNERQIGWGLYALTGIYEATGDQKYLDAAVYLANYLVSNMSPTGKFDIRYDNRIAFMNGLAMGGLLTVAQHTDDDFIDEGILRVARRTWGLYVEYACRTLNAFSWALEQTNDPRYLDILERTWKTSMNYLTGAVNVDTFSWHFTYFAARYQLFPLFDEVPAVIPNPKTWKGLQLTGQELELYVKSVGNEPAAVWVMLKGLTEGKVEMYKLDGTPVKSVELDNVDKLFKVAPFEVEGQGQIYRLVLTTAQGRLWQIHYDAGSHVVICDPKGENLHEIHPQAFGMVRPGTQTIKVQALAEGEGYRFISLYDSENHLLGVTRKFIDFQDPGRYQIEVQAELTDEMNGPFGVEIYEANVSGLDGFYPYWAASPEELFNPEQAEQNSDGQ